MSLSSTASARRPARAAVAAAVAVAVLAPLAVLAAQVWSGTRSSLAFTADERRGVEYLRPLTKLLAVATEAQSAAVSGRQVNAAAVRAAVAEVQAVDDRLGRTLRTTDRWTTVRGIVEDRVSRTWTEPAEAYQQFSDLTTGLLELNRTVGDNSRLILDPGLDAYYVMNATLLRIPEILVDSGRYADLSTLTAGAGRPDAAALAQLTAARNRVASDEADLSAGLVKAFTQTGSSTLGPALTRQLDDFRTAVGAVAPSNSLLAPVPDRSPADLAADQAALQRSALALDQAALDQLDRLLAGRAGDERRARTIALVATGFGVLVAAGLSRLVWRWSAPAAAPPPAAAPEPVLLERLGSGRAAR
jgi:hypothetical protein